MNSTRNVTIKDVAKLAGVSISTASRSLAGIGGVSEALEAKIVDAASKLSYRPNAAARSLRRARTSTFGIVFNNLSGPGQLELLKGIGVFCTEAGLNLLAADANGNHRLYLEQIARFYEQRVEGLFLVSPTDLGESLADYRRAQIPVITLLRRDTSAGTAPIVAASEGRAIHQAIADLADMGHQDIAYFLRFWDDRRLSQLQSALASTGCNASSTSCVFEEEAPAEMVSSAVRQALTVDEKPSALVVHSSFLGSVLRAIQDLGLRSPEDVSVLSLGSSSWQQLLTPSIAAIEVDSRALGALACEVMMDWLAGKDPQPTYSELARWVRRETAGPVSAAIRLQ